MFRFVTGPENLKNTVRVVPSSRVEPSDEFMVQRINVRVWYSERNSLRRVKFDFDPAETHGSGTYVGPFRHVTET